MRGLPGAGKSTWIASQPGLKFICCADSYRMRNGFYEYKKSEDSIAHGESLKSFVQFLQVGCPETVYVDNTNTTAVEIAPYAQLCSAYGVKFRIVYIYCDLVTAYKRNIHNVPADTLIKMQTNLMFDKLPTYWPQEAIV